MELDIYIPTIKIGIEYDGVAWHKKNERKESDRKKYLLCKQQGIRLLRVREDATDSCHEICDTLLSIKSMPSYEELDSVLKRLLSELACSVNIDIDTERDSSQIMADYLVNLHSHSLATIMPEIAGQWHPSKNGQLQPDMFSPKSNFKMWWMCANGHEWQATINDRSAGHGCPYCSNQKVLTGYNDFATKNPLVATEWHPTKNGDLLPTQVTAGTEQVVWWQCSNGHEWKAPIYLRNRGKRKCPECSKLRKKGCEQLGFLDMIKTDET